MHCLCKLFRRRYIAHSFYSSKALHGIFHTPVFENGEPVARARQGYRVAITARITKADSDEILEPYVKNGHYCAVYGPDGNKTLCL